MDVFHLTTLVDSDRTSPVSSSCIDLGVVRRQTNQSGLILGRATRQWTTRSAVVFQTTRPPSSATFFRRQRMIWTFPCTFRLGHFYLANTTLMLNK